MEIVGKTQNFFCSLHLSADQGCHFSRLQIGNKFEDNTVLKTLSEVKPPLDLIVSQYVKKESGANLPEIRESFDLSYLFDFFKRNSVNFDVPYIEGFACKVLNSKQ